MNASSAVAKPLTSVRMSPPWTVPSSVWVSHPP